MIRRFDSHYIHKFNGKLNSSPAVFCGDKATFCRTRNAAQSYFNEFSFIVVIFKRQNTLPFYTRPQTLNYREYCASQCVCAHIA